MLGVGNESQTILFAVRLYRSLVSAYPSKFRREYGGLMVQAFRDGCRRAAGEGGMPALLDLWAWTVVDFLKSVLEEYANGGVNMTRDKFVRLSGWAMILGSLAFIIGIAAGSRPEYNPYNAASLPIDRYANQAGFPLAALGIVLISLGLLGMFFRYGRQAGAFARICLGLGAFSGMVSVAGIIGMQINNWEPWWYIFFFGVTIQFLTLALFGIANLKLKVLPRGNVVPLIAGIWLPLLVAFNLGIGFEPSDTFLIVSLLVGLGGMALLGFLLQADSRASSPAAAGV